MLKIEITEDNLSINGSAPESSVVACCAALLLSIYNEHHRNDTLSQFLNKFTNTCLEAKIVANEKYNSCTGN